jgi:hypothetical protein
VKKENTKTVSYYIQTKLIAVATRSWIYPVVGSATLNTARRMKSLSGFMRVMLSYVTTDHCPKCCSKCMKLAFFQKLVILSLDKPEGYSMQVEEESARVT